MSVMIGSRPKKGQEGTTPAKTSGKTKETGTTVKTKKGK